MCVCVKKTVQPLLWLKMRRDCPRLIYQKTSLAHFNGSSRACVCLLLMQGCSGEMAHVCRVDGGGLVSRLFAGQGVCIVGVKADSRIPFALVSVGLDQVWPLCSSAWSLVMRLWAPSIKITALLRGHRPLPPSLLSLCLHPLWGVKAASHSDG